MTRRKPRGRGAALPPDIAGLETRLGHRFKTPDLLVQALTHSSAADDRRRSNERLEFLGDRVLGLIVARLLLETYPDEDEGQVSYRFSALVKSPTLYRVAESVGLEPYVRLSEGEASAGGRDNAALIANCCEAVIAALFIDGGLDAAETFVRRHWQPLLKEQPLPPKDAKTTLQEWAQGQGLPLPEYRVAEQRGPGHAPVFRVAVTVETLPTTEAEGPSKRAAEQSAAELMLRRIGSRV
jgi:ribonuclease-3